jgi:hypothetical protein
MSFNNLLLALALTVLWPLVLMGMLAAAEWLERRTLAGGEVASREPRPALSAPPEPAQAGVTEADAGVAAASWPAAGRAAPGGTHAASPDGARGGAPDRGPFDGGAERERVVARRPFGGGGRHLRRAGGGRHERRG